VEFLFLFWRTLFQEKDSASLSLSLTHTHTRTHTHTHTHTHTQATVSRVPVLVSCCCSVLQCAHTHCTHTHTMSDCCQSPSPRISPLQYVAAFASTETLLSNRAAKPHRMPYLCLIFAGLFPHKSPRRHGWRVHKKPALNESSQNHELNEFTNSMSSWSFQVSFCKRACQYWLLCAKETCTQCIVSRSPTQWVHELN